MNVDIDESTVVWKVSGGEYLLRYLRKRAAKALSRKRVAVNSLRIACIPGDDIGDNVIAHGWYEDCLLHALFEGLLRHRVEALATGVALDVGANIGNHSLYFSRRFRKVIAFEPNPICSHLLEANLLLNNISNVALVASGLSDRVARASFHMNGAGNIGNSGVNAAFVKDAVAAFDVDLLIGDDVLTEQALGGLRVEVLKIDVEGHELPVLKGLVKMLRKHQPVVLFESHGALGDAGSDHVVRFLASHGYEYYYVIERDRPTVSSRLLRAVRRAFLGERFVAKRVARPGDRSYGLVVASPRDLLDGNDPGNVRVSP